MVQATSPVNPPIFENIPEQLTERPQWVCWRIAERPGKKPTKVPFTPGTERRASTTDILTWRTYPEAVGAYKSGRYDGIGFCFCSADPFVGIDLDGCRNPETAEIEPWARRIMDGISEGYVEASPSGTGVHIIAGGVLKEGVKRGSIEIYGQDRFFTISGAVIAE